jgi:hypothetical protein
MYILFALVVLVICLLIFFSPIFAIVLAAVSLVGLGIYKFFGPGTEPEHAPPRSDVERTHEDDEETGLWGEQWPEQRHGSEGSSS